MVKLKKGDLLVSKDEIWRLQDVNGGNHLLILIYPKQSIAIVDTASHSKVKHMLINLGYKVVHKEKASTINVLYD